MTQKRWKLSVTELGSTKVVAETVVEAGDWMTGLGRARGQIGEKAGVPQGSSVSVAPDGTVTILDPVGRRQYRLTATAEALPAAAPAASAPAAAAAAAGPAGKKKPDFKKTMAYIPPSASAAAPEVRAVGGPAVPEPAAPAVVAAPSVASAPVLAPAVAAALAAAVAPAAAPAAAAAAPVAAPGAGPKKVSRATVAYMVSPVAAAVNGQATEAAPPRAVSVPPPARPASVSPPGRPASQRPAPIAPATSTPAAVEAAAASPPPAPPEAPATPARSTDGDLEILFSRDSEPSAESPLVYRERNWLLAEGASAEDAELFLRTRFAAMREELKARPKGKLLKLAAFDHRWTGQPQRPPVLVLTWKDWRGEPEVIAPTRMSAPPMSSASFAPTSSPPIAPAMPVAVSLPPVAPTPSVPTPSVPAPTGPVASPVAAEPVAPVAAPAIDAAPAATAPAPEPRHSTPPMPAQPSVMIDPSLMSVDAATTLEDVPAVRVSTASSQRPIAAPSAATKPRTDDRLAQAFEGMQDLFFLPTPADAADYLLRLIGELVPSEAASVALYDINTDELRFVAAVGVGADERKGDAVPSQVGLLGSAVHDHEVCMLVSDVTTDKRFDPGIDGRVGLEATNLAVMPVAVQGRLLGAIQLLNRVGDLEFSRADANLLQYLAQRFGEFLHQHKVAAPRRSVPNAKR